MDFTIPDDLRELQETVRRLVQREIIPLEQEIEANQRVPEVLIEKCRQMGRFGMTIPEEYGGGGLGTLGYTLVSEELGHAHPGVRSMVGINNGMGSKALVLYGTEDQKQRFLPGLASGELLSAFAVSEPNAGSDVSAIETRAERRGDQYILNGSKHFITNAPYADVLTVLAATDKDASTSKKLTAFLVEKDSPGFIIGKNQETMGSGGCARSELRFDDCTVPAANVLGAEGQGFEVAMSTLAESRITYAAFCVGSAQRLLDMSCEYAKVRVQFGRPIAAFQGIQFMLAEMATSIYAARLASYHVAWKYERGEECAQEASMAKLFASETAGKVADSAVQIHGAMGYARECAVERLYRDVRVYRIAEGTSEIQKILIARKLLE